MRKTVLTFGLIAGAILSAMMLVTLPFMDRIGFDKGMVIGYTGMVLAFLLVYFGIRSYRDNVAGGQIGFGRAFMVGLAITVVASACYVATWQFIYYKITPDFADRYTAYVVEQAKKSGESDEKIAAQTKEIREMMEIYKNPLANIAISFLEPLPVGLVFSLVSAGLLRRKRNPG
ncbi:MAG: DUF4199 domain-containing protein [Burkholderiales bacterium]|nr:MAG: DUF4199 domain-containing protein [Burkholderiales bacterium]